MLEEAIFSEIKNDVTIAAKLSAGGGKFRIYPLRVPDGVPPNMCLTYTEISQSYTRPAVRGCRFQISCIAPTFEDARGLANDIDRIFNEFPVGQLGGSFGVTHIQFVGRSVLYDEAAKLYVYPVELFIKY